MIKLCIFDLDGTILNTLETIAYYLNCQLERNGIEPIETEKYKILVGDGAKNLIKKALELKNSYTDELFSKIYSEYMKSYIKNTTYKTTPYDGIEKLLNDLKNDGIKIAIVSNKPDPQAKSVIKEILGENLFDCVTGQLDGYPIKPDPCIVLKTIDEFNVSKEECVYIGDTSVDMKTGKNAGIFAVGVTWGFRDRKELEDNGADLIIDHPYELYNYIKNMK